MHFCWRLRNFHPWRCSGDFSVNGFARFEACGSLVNLLVQRIVAISEHNFFMLLPSRMVGVFDFAGLLSI